MYDRKATQENVQNYCTSKG